MLSSSQAIIALDVGAKRIGVASANPVARIAHPLITLDHTEDILAKIEQLAAQERAAMVVIGLPRGMQGQETDQTRVVEAFGAEVEKQLGLPIHWQDEAVTSHKAEEELISRGKPYVKGDIDALAATYILEDFLNEHPEIKA
jgi:putative holliday junction resolvase